MIRQVPQDDMEKVKPLAAGVDDQIMAQAVLDGTRPGVVLSNDEKAPSSVFIAAPEGSFAWTYLCGRANDNAFNDALHHWLFDEEGLGGKVVFSFLVCDDASWKSALKEILAPRVSIPDRRLFYSCAHAPRAWREEIPEGYSILPVNEDLLQSAIEIPEKVEQWFDHNFGSRYAFLQRGFGAVAVHDNRIVGWCLADSVASNRADIGPETEEAHQRKGLAAATTCLTLEQGFDRGLEKIGWHCHVINEPSIKTANSAGFKLNYEYPAYAVHFDVEKHVELASMIGDEIVGQAREALHNGFCEEAHRLFECALGFSTHEDPAVYVQAAHAASCCNEIDVAFTRLENAFTLGWIPPTRERVQPELARLTTDPRWTALEG